MLPILIDLGTWKLPLLGETHLFLPTYGMLFAGGVLLAWWWFLKRGRALGIDETVLFNLSFYSLLAGIVGAKLALIALQWRDYLADPVELLGTIRSAGVLLGGVIGGALVFCLYARRHGLPVLRLGDAIAAPLALGQAVGRLGCFSAGCCWGKRVDGGFFSTVFTNPDARAQTGVPLDVPLAPTQLVQMTHDLLLTALLTWLWRRRPEPEGTVFWVYLLVYSIGRGTIEFWRGDGDRGLYFGGQISTSQLLALAGLVISLAMLLRGFRLRRAQAT